MCKETVGVISPFQSFVEDVAYTLSQLKLKEEEQRIEAICHMEMTFLSLPAGFGRSICFHVLPLGNLATWMEKKSCVTVVSPLSSSH